MIKLPKNYRIVENANGRFWVQKKWLFWWFDFKYAVDSNYIEYTLYSPKYSSKEEACRKVLAYLTEKEDQQNSRQREGTIVNKYRC